MECKRSAKDIVGENGPSDICGRYLHRTYGLGQIVTGFPKTGITT